MKVLGVEVVVGVLEVVLVVVVVVIRNRAFPYVMGRGKLASKATEQFPM